MPDHPSDLRRCRDCDKILSHLESGRCIICEQVVKAHEGYPEGWAKVTLMVSPDGNSIHAVAGDREPGIGDTDYTGFKRIMCRIHGLRSELKFIKDHCESSLENH